MSNCNCGDDVIENGGFCIRHQVTKTSRVAYMCKHSSDSCLAMDKYRSSLVKSKMPSNANRLLTLLKAIALWAIDSFRPCSESSYRQRIIECEKCFQYDNGICCKCGCYVKIKAMMRYQRCPLDHPRWTSDEKLYPLGKITSEFVSGLSIGNTPDGKNCGCGA